MNPDVENRLREAFTARTASITEQSLQLNWDPTSLTPGFRPEHQRRGWVVVSLASAAVVVVAAGVLIGIDRSSHHSEPVAPIMSQEPTTSTHPSQSPTSTPTVSGPTVEMKTLTLDGGITMQVPVGWSSAPDNPSCITVGGVPANDDAAKNCQISIIPFDRDSVLTPHSARYYDANRVGLTGGLSGMCVGSGVRATDHETLVDSREQTIGGQRAEYREWTADCVTHSFKQWAVMSAPFVTFIRQMDDPATDSEAERAILSATFSGSHSTLWLDDVGLITKVTAGGSSISLVPITWGWANGIHTTGSATVNYLLSSNTKIGYYASTSISVEPVDLTRAQLTTLVAGGSIPGVPPMSDLIAEISTDGANVLTVELLERTAFVAAHTP